MKNITDSNVYKQAINEIFQEYIKHYIDKKIKFYPFQDLSLSNFIYEINHVNKCLIYFKGNIFDLINSKVNGREKINNIFYLENWYELILIMNENNYEQNINEFRNNFINIRGIVKASKGQRNLSKLKREYLKAFTMIQLEIKKC